MTNKFADSSFDSFMEEELTKFMEDNKELFDDLTKLEEQEKKNDKSKSPTAAEIAKALINFKPIVPLSWIVAGRKAIRNSK